MCRERARCGPEGGVFQYRTPNWGPLLDAVGERLTGTFMWMHEERLDGELPVHAYKHIWTRRYIYLASGGRAFDRTPCDALVPLRLDFAIEQALCSWWILSGWDEDDRQAVIAAVERVQLVAEDS